MPGRRTCWAGSPPAAPWHRWPPRSTARGPPAVYADAWLAHVVLPALTGNEVWAHPLVRGAFDARLRRRLLAAADALPALLDELDDAPAATAHGDACTANLLVAGDRDALVMVDLGFCGKAPLGTDLGTAHRGRGADRAAPPR